MRILICIILLTFGFQANGQTWRDIVNATDDFKVACENAEAYFDQRGTGRGSGYKQYRRWKFEMEKRVSRDNKMKNFGVLDFKEYKKTQKKLASQNTRVNSDWESIGPFDYEGANSGGTGGIGRTTCTAFHPTNTNIWYVGTAAGGLWKTTDAGNTWSPMTDDFASIGISAVVVNQDNPDIIYILTGDGRAGDTRSIGVIKTEDGGAHWEFTDIELNIEDKKYGMAMIAHPTNPEILYVGINGDGLYKTENGGTSFSLVEPLANQIFDIEFIPGSQDTMLMSSNSGLYRSENAGDSWAPISSSVFPTSFDRFDIAVSPSAPNYVYLLFNGDTGVNGTFRGCFMSLDYGQNFFMRSNSPNILGWDDNGNDSGDQGARDLGLVVDPANHLRLFAGGVSAWRSEDGGASWTRITKRKPDATTTPYMHADQQNFYYVNGKLIANNDGGIYYSIDNGNSWTEVSPGLCISQFYEIDVYANEYIGGLQDNGTLKDQFDDGEVAKIQGGDGFGCTWHTGDHSIKYISTQAGVTRRQAGTNITIKEDNFWYAEIEMHTTDPDYFFVDSKNKLYRAHEVTLLNYDFEDLGTGQVAMDGDILSFSQAIIDDDVMYVVSSDTLLKTTNLSASSPVWNVCSTIPSGDATYSDVVVDPYNVDRVWVSCSSYEDGMKIFESIDGGDSWTNISGSLENVAVRNMIYHNGAYPGLYIGTTIGVNYKGNTMSDWIPFSNYLPNTNVEDIEIDGGYLTIGTHGRGIWRAPLYNACPYSLNLTNGNDPSNALAIGRQDYHVLNSLTSTREIQGVHAEVYYSTENYIDLKPGFIAKSYTFLEAKVDGCPD
ncbi:MAG: hypothetical protein P1U56_09480 [Saprospiraceae bacterium]|nr:hypothetical protein [Saprospiraceae bacterium]